MHKQCLSRACSTPESQLIQVILCKFSYFMICIFFIIEYKSMIITDILKKLFFICKIFIQVDFCKKKRKILEIFPLYFLIPVFTDFLSMLEYIMVILKQHIFRNLMSYIKSGFQLLCKNGYTIFRISFVCRIFKIFA